MSATDWEIRELDRAHERELDRIEARRERINERRNSPPPSEPFEAEKCGVHIPISQRKFESVTRATPAEVENIDLDALVFGLSALVERFRGIDAESDVTRIRKLVRDAKVQAEVLHMLVLEMRK